MDDRKVSRLERLWRDIESWFTRDELFTHITIYWAAESIGTSFLPYYDYANAGPLTWGKERTLFRSALRALQCTFIVSDEFLYAFRRQLVREVKGFPGIIEIQFLVFNLLHRFAFIDKLVVR